MARTAADSRQLELWCSAWGCARLWRQCGAGNARRGGSGAEARTHQHVVRGLAEQDDGLRGVDPFVGRRARVAARAGEIRDAFEHALEAVGVDGRRAVRSRSGGVSRSLWAYRGANPSARGTLDGGTLSQSACPSPASSSCSICRTISCLRFTGAQTNALCARAASLTVP